MDRDHRQVTADGDLRSRQLRGRFDEVVRRRLPLFQFAFDAAAWALAIPLATIARYDFELDDVNVSGVLSTVVVAAVLQGLIGALLGLYRRQYHYGSLEEVRTLGFSVAGVSLVLIACVRARPDWVPRSVPVTAACLALVVACVVRFVARLVEDRQLRPATDRSEPVVVMGAGNAGRQIVRTMLRDPASPYRPAAFLDDDPQKARLRIGGLRVEGSRADLERVAQVHGASHVLVAIPSATGQLLQEITGPLVRSGLDVLVLPPVAELLGSVKLSDIRPLTVADLLGRRPAEIDTAAIAGYVTGRRVLVTGAGGSIGSELCRQLDKFGPATLVMLDRDESGLHATQLSIDGRALLDTPALALADLRDRERIVELFHEHRPEVVFHAAALKHQPLLELHPTEAWKTNVVGTHHVLDAAEAVGVGRFVNISTDKAADPEGVLGYSKRLCERLTANAGAKTGKSYVSVRFGNVLGSRGSMLGTFERQVVEGGPITVTHPEVSRYFMTVEEAVALTIQAGALGEPGEVLVLDMGRPVMILDVARRFAEQSEPPLEIVFTGLRRNEKLHEVLLGDGEEDVRPKHPLISHVPVPPLDFGRAEREVWSANRDMVTAASLAAAVAMPAAGADRDTLRVARIELTG